MKRIAVTAAVLVLAACALPGAQHAGLDVQGHRGARGLAPENTLRGFDVALATGVSTLELDVVVTRDDVPVIAHDLRLNPDLTRDADGRWLDGAGPPIRALTLAELQRYDVGRLKPGTRYAETFAQQQPRDGERMPTLAALFERVAAAGDSRVRFNIETKLNPEQPQASPEPAAFARLLLDVIRAHRMESRVTVQSFDWRTLREVQRTAPTIPTACLSAQRSGFDTIGGDGRWTAGLKLADHGGSVPRLVRAAGCAVWSPHFGDLTPAALDEARALGLRVIVWTVNQPADIEGMLAMGVDGLISDYPDRVHAALHRNGMRDNRAR